MNNSRCYCETAAKKFEGNTIWFGPSLYAAVRVCVQQCGRREFRCCVYYRPVYTAAETSEFRRPDDRKRSFTILQI